MKKISKHKFLKLIAFKDINRFEDIQSEFDRVSSLVNSVPRWFVNTIPNKEIINAISNNYAKVVSYFKRYNETVLEEDKLDISIAATMNCKNNTLREYSLSALKGNSLTYRISSFSYIDNWGLLNNNLIFDYTKE